MKEGGITEEKPFLFDRSHPLRKLYQLPASLRSDPWMLSPESLDALKRNHWWTSPEYADSKEMLRIYDLVLGLQTLSLPGYILQSNKLVLHVHLDPGRMHDPISLLLNFSHLFKNALCVLNQRRITVSVSGALATGGEYMRTDRKKNAKKNGVLPTSLPAIQPKVAGIDVGSSQHWVCGPAKDDGKP